MDKERAREILHIKKPSDLFDLSDKELLARMTFDARQTRLAAEKTATNISVILWIVIVNIILVAIAVSSAM